MPIPLQKQAFLQLIIIFGVVTKHKTTNRLHGATVTTFCPYSFRRHVGGPYCADFVPEYVCCNSKKRQTSRFWNL